jgi:hypothetical protein
VIDTSHLLHSAVAQPPHHRQYQTSMLNRDHTTMLYTTWSRK